MVLELSRAYLPDETNGKLECNGKLIFNTIWRLMKLRTGTASGTFLSILPNVFSEDIATTIILAVVGATVSFMVSLFL